MNHKEILETFQQLLVDQTYQTSNVLYFGEAGPYLLALQPEKPDKLIYCYESMTFEKFIENPDSFSATGCDPVLFFETVQAMDVPGVGQDLRNYELEFRKIVQHTRETRNEIEAVISNNPNLLASTILIAPADDLC